MSVGRLARYGRLAADLARGAFAEATGGEIGLPFKLTVCLTFRCNHRCGICSIWERDKGRELTADELDRFFASAGSVSWLDLTGGEIVLRRDLEAIVASVHRHLPRLAMLHFPTNGLLPEAAERAARAMVRRGGPKVVVTISIDGPPDLHDRLRGMSGAFDAAMETWDRLARVPGVDVYAGFTLQEGNLEALGATVAALASRRPGFTPSGLHVNYLHRSAHYFDNLHVRPPAPDAVARALAEFSRAKGAPRDPVRLVEWAYLRLAQQNLRDGRSAVPCRSGELSAYVGPDGTVYACTIDERPIGRLADHGFDLRKLWATSERVRLREEIRADRCPGCWTACEANQSLLASPRATVEALRGSR